MKIWKFGLTVLVGCNLAFSAHAHPHVFIDAIGGFVFDDRQHLSAVRVTWTYDAFTSLVLIDVLDIDRDDDGVLDENDRARIVEAQTIWPDTFEGDTYLEQNGVPVVLTRPENGSASMQDFQISVHFDVPLETPLSDLSELVLRLYDPTYYYAYSTIALETGLPANCATQLVPFEPDDATQQLQLQLASLSRDETPAQAGIGRRFADEVRLICD